MYQSPSEPARAVAAHATLPTAARPSSAMRDAADPSPRAATARRALAGAAALGLLADGLLRDGPWGVGLLVWMAALAALVVALVRHAGRPMGAESRVWLGAAVLFAATLSWRDADLLRFFDVLAMLASLVLLAMSLSAVPVAGLGAARVRDLVRAAIGSGVGVAVGVVPLVLRDAAPHETNVTRGRAARVARALLLAAPVVVVFALLLANADPVFGSFFTVPNLDLDVALSHVVIPGFFAWVVAGWLRRALFGEPSATGSAGSTLSLTLGATDVAVALGALAVLFAAFVATQVGWLFGGEALVRRTTGLGYAEYARRGFFELMWVAGLLLPVLLGARALIAESDARTLRLYRRLALALAVLLGAILVSAAARMRLYVHFYGLSTDRLYASAVMIWLAIVFAWLALTVLRSRPRAFAAGMVASGFAVLLVLNALSPDALVARSNLARGPATVAGVAGNDLPYVSSLGGDAVPLAVAAVTSPAAAASAATDSATALRRCIAAQVLVNEWTGERAAEGSRRWTQWNLARSRATRAVRVHEAELRALACPQP